MKDATPDAAKQAKQRRPPPAAGARAPKPAARAAARGRGAHGGGTRRCGADGAPAAAPAGPAPAAPIPPEQGGAQENDSRPPEKTAAGAARDGWRNQSCDRQARDRRASEDNKYSGYEARQEFRSGAQGRVRGRVRCRESSGILRCIRRRYTRSPRRFSSTSTRRRTRDRVSRRPAEPVDAGAGGSDGSPRSCAKTKTVRQGDDRGASGRRDDPESHGGASDVPGDDHSTPTGLTRHWRRRSGARRGRSEVRP